MPLTIDISVPKMYRSVVEYWSTTDRARISVETARLRARCVEVGLAIALMATVSKNNHDVVLFTPSAAKIKLLIARWMDRSAKINKYRQSTKDMSATGYSFGSNGGTLWVVDGEPNLKDLPFTMPSDVIVVEANGFSRDVTSLFPTTRTIVLGDFCDNTHWFYNWSRKKGVDLFQFGSDDIVRCFPDQKDQVLKADDPYYRRHMLLEDIRPDFGGTNFDEFAQERLFIKSDKPNHVLSDRQKTAAKDQISKQKVIPFDTSALQKHIRSVKRKAVEDGKSPYFIIVKYRRGGITTQEQAESYRVAVTQPQSDVVTLAHTGPATQRIFKMVSMFHKLDPKAPKLLNDSRSSLAFENGSNFFIGTAGGEGFLRGDGISRVHGSEVAKWCVGPRQMEKVDDLIAGIIGAAAHGEIVLETTPNGREWVYQNYQDAKTGVNDFTPIFLRWFDDPMNQIFPSDLQSQEILDTLTAEEKELIKQHSLSMSQILFRRVNKRRYRHLFVQEMPEDDVTCFIASGTCYFDIEKIMHLSQQVPDLMSKAKRLPGGYELRWEPPVPGRKYVAGVDTSEGLPGCDKAGIGVLDKETGAQVCSLHGLFPPRILADHVVRICKDYNDALVGIERENHGHAVLQRVIELGYSKPHFRGGSLFFFDHKSDISKSRAGWTTNENTRAIMLESLAEAIEEDLMVVRDRDFISELGSFRLQSNGKFEADPGAHDDTVIKWAIAWQMRRQKIAKPDIMILGD